MPREGEPVLSASEQSVNTTYNVLTHICFCRNYKPPKVHLPFRIKDPCRANPLIMRVVPVS